LENWQNDSPMPLLNSILSINNKVSHDYFQQHIHKVEHVITSQPNKIKQLQQTEDAYDSQG
jgi:hypothetical protein